jgi:hypothetical protein
MDKKKCSVCHKKKSLCEFSKLKSRYDGLQQNCKACRKQYDKERYKNNKNYFLLSNQARYFRNREFVKNILKESFCVDCGEKDIVVLDFDHVSEKSFSVSLMSYNSIKRIQSEIDKCVVRCANCHRRKTAKEQGWSKLF